jgi:hypothetical protein
MLKWAGHIVRKIDNRPKMNSERTSQRIKTSWKAMEQIGKRSVEGCRTVARYGSERTK